MNILLSRLSNFSNLSNLDFSSSTLVIYRNHGLDLPGVIPKYRKKGIGYTLFFHLLKSMQRKGYPKAIADTGINRKDATRMYNRFGLAS